MGSFWVICEVRKPTSYSFFKWIIPPSSKWMKPIDLESNKKEFLDEANFRKENHDLNIIE